MVGLCKHLKSGRMKGMESSSFPVQWIALIISLVAIVIGVPALLQMKYGSPKVVVGYEDEEFGEYRCLSCTLYNDPITRGLLRIFGVRREMAQDVIARFMISERGTGRIVCPFTEVQIKTQQDVAARRIVLPASLVPARFPVVYYAREKTEVTVCKEQKQIIPLGVYIATIDILAGDKLYEEEHGFVVSDKYPFAEWGNC